MVTSGEKKSVPHSVDIGPSRPAAGLDVLVSLRVVPGEGASKFGAGLGSLLLPAGATATVTAGVLGRAVLVVPLSLSPGFARIQKVLVKPLVNAVLDDGHR